jgi:hypothetical protein
VPVGICRPRVPVTQGASYGSAATLNPAERILPTLSSTAPRVSTTTAKPAQCPGGAAPRRRHGRRLPGGADGLPPGGSALCVVH